MEYRALSTANLMLEMEGRPPTMRAANIRRGQPPSDRAQSELCPVSIRTVVPIGPLIVGRAWAALIGQATVAGPGVAGVAIVVVRVAVIVWRGQGCNSRGNACRTPVRPVCS